MLSDTPTTYITAKTTEPGAVPAESIKEAPVAEKPKTVFIPNANGASTAVKIPSLKDISGAKQTVAEEEDPYVKGDSRDDFTFDDFIKQWNAYAATIKAEGKMSLFTIFKTEEPKMLRPYVFEVVVESKVLDNLFRDEKPPLLNFLRENLKNYSIEVNTRVEEQVAVKRPYTTQEKFQHMAAKNPQLAELKKRFNLDFD